jgi:hypothetical protein
MRGSQADSCRREAGDLGLPKQPGWPFHCCDPGRFAEDLGLGIGWLAELTMSGAWSSGQ